MKAKKKGANRICMHTSWFRSARRRLLLLPRRRQQQQLSRTLLCRLRPLLRAIPGSPGTLATRLRGISHYSTLSSIESSSPFMKDQPIGDVPEGFETLREGEATVLVPRGKSAGFYNPAQVVNRDLTIAVIRTHIEERLERGRDRPLRILEGLAATGEHVL